MKVEYNSIKKSTQPKTQDGIDVQYSAAKRSGYKVRWYMLILLILLPLIYLAWNAIRPVALVLAPGIITVEPLEIKTDKEVTVQSVLIQHGENVAKGQPLIILFDAKLNATIVELQRQLDALNKANVIEDVEILKRLNDTILTAKKGVKRQDKLITVFRDFEKRGIVPTADMAAILQANTRSKMQLSQAHINLLDEQRNIRKERLAGDITQQKNAIYLKLSELQVEQQQLTIKAPFAGKIIDISIQEGEHLITNQPIVLLSGRDAPVVVSYVNAKYLNYISVGQKVIINLPNGESVRAEIKESVTLVSKIPSQLSGPFDGKKSAMKVVFSLDKKLKRNVEGIPVEIHFDYRSLIKSNFE